jgi:hypothetical protein
MDLSEHGFFSQGISTDLYSKIAEIINTQFSNRIFDEDIVERVIKELEVVDRTTAAEKVVQNIISNRQLIYDNFL